MATKKNTDQLALLLQRRTTIGTRPVKRLRREGLIPGVVYGRDMKPLAVSVNHHEFVKVLHSKTGEHTLVTLRLQDGTPWEKPALVHEVQHDPVDGRVVHIDFHAILLTERIKVKIPVVLKGEPVGVKEESGVLEHFLREIEVECLPTEIPVNVEFDVSEMKIGDTIHVRDLAAPKNAAIITDAEGALASVQAPKEEEPEEEAAAAEPEVITEKKEEGEAKPGEEGKGEPRGGEAKKGAAKSGGEEKRAGESKSS